MPGLFERKKLRLDGSFYFQIKAIIMKKSIATLLSIAIAILSFGQQFKIEHKKFSVYKDSLNGSKIYKGSNRKHIIHLSDIHLYKGKPKKKRKHTYINKSIKNFKDVCIDISQRFDSSKTYIITTGDFTESNKRCLARKELKEANSIIYEHLIKNKFVVFITPGNHDFSKDWRGYSDKRRGDFYNAFKSLIIEKEEGVNKDTIDELLFVGVNSMKKSKGKMAIRNFKRMCYGEFDNNQIRDLKEILNNNNDCIKIVYSHHAIKKNNNFFKSFQKAKKREEILEAISSTKGADLFLHGHRHVFWYEARRKNEEGLCILECNSLSSTRKYYVIELK